MEDRVTTATPGAPLHRHHIVKVKDAPHLRLNEDNLLNVCETCHVTLDALYETNRGEYVTRATELKRVRDELLGGMA